MKRGGERGGKNHPQTMVEPPRAQSRVTELGHIVLSIGYALLISTTLIRCGGHAKIFAHN